MQHPFSKILTTRFKVRIIRALLEEEEIRLLLDVGCGGAFMLSQLEDLYDIAIGIDMSPEAIEFGQLYTKAKLQVGNAEKLDFKDDEFDCIISTDAFEHIPDDKAAIEEAHRVLKDNGIIIIYTPSENGLLSKTKWVDLYHQSEKSYLLDQRYYTIQSLSSLAKNAGFIIEYVGYHNIFFQEFFTQLLKLISKLMGKEYEHQACIFDFTKSKFFPVYRWLLLPIISMLVLIEEFVFENIFRRKVPGHRIIMKARKYHPLISD